MVANVFRGKSGLKVFLNPQYHNTPLVELPDYLNPFHDDKVHIFVKMQSFLPLMNIKSLPAYGMLDDFENDNLHAQNLVESSSGNTAFSLSILSRQFGFEKMRAIVSSEVGIGKLQMLLLSGAEVFVNQEPICPNPHDENSGINLAKKLAQKEAWYNANQYANQANPKSHFENTGQQIFEQLEGDIQVFCSSLGTSGSLLGSSKYLKSQNQNIKTVGVVRKPNNPVPGPRTLGLLKMIDFNWEEACDDIVAIGTFEAYKNSLELCRSGILGGPSTGLNLAGLLKYLSHMKRKHLLKDLQNNQGEINCVFLCCDTPFPYLNDYFERIPKRYFPKIYNQDLLKDKIKFQTKVDKDDKISVVATKMLKNIFNQSNHHIWKTLEADETVSLKDDCVIVDIRENNKFQDAHIPSSINLSEKELLDNELKHIQDWEQKTVIFVCEYGELSFYIAKFYQSLGIKAYSLQEGFIKWSELNYPRTSLACKILRNKPKNTKFLDI